MEIVDGGKCKVQWEEIEHHKILYTTNIYIVQNVWGDVELETRLQNIASMSDEKDEL